MKKRIIFSLLLILSIFTLTACGDKNENNEKEDTKKEEKKVDETLFTINKLEFHLDKETEFKGIKYTISKDFQEAIHDQYIQYNYYQEDNTNLLFFRVFYYENKDIKYALKDLGLEENVSLTDGKTDNIEYKFYETPRDDGGTIHFYFITKDKNLYVINFVSKYDIKEYENKEIKTIKF
jgi:predicted small lipoprotein YifL